MTTLDTVKVREELEDSIQAICQSRSNFQIERFVIGEYTTPERQFQQCVLELQVKLQNIKRTEINIQKLQRKLKATNDDLEQQEILLDIEDAKYSLKSQMREAGTLYSIYTALPKFTYQQLQDAEEQYWIERLGRQAMTDINANGRISVGNQEALRMIGAVTNDFAERFYKIGQEEQKAIQ